MSRKYNKPAEYLDLTIEKLVHGGQGLATTPEGKKVFVWGALPGESVRARLTKKKKDYFEAIAEELFEASQDRVSPKEQNYLNTSPWQIINYSAENNHKKLILEEAFRRENIDILVSDFKAPENQWHYRNKMEYSFYGDDDGLHLALFNRGTHRKVIVDGSAIARAEIDEVANEILQVLSSAGARASQLKSLVLRCDSEGNVVSALFVRDSRFGQIDALGKINKQKGLVVVYSNEKSPASVRTQDLYQFGDVSLEDDLFGVRIKYDVFSFFQVNLPIFREALQDIRLNVGDSAVTDFYSGVGTIGLCLENTKNMIEVDSSNVIWAKKNVGDRDIDVVHVSSEKALQYVSSGNVLIVDPPRSGLHKDLVEKILEEKPGKVVYLSCNSSTQARDVNLLLEKYNIDELFGYNFFPRTPHIESLAILSLK